MNQIDKIVLQCSECGKKLVRVQHYPRITCFECKRRLAFIKRKKKRI